MHGASPGRTGPIPVRFAGSCCLPWGVRSHVQCRHQIPSLCPSRSRRHLRRGYTLSGGKKIGGVLGRAFGGKAGAVLGGVSLDSKTADVVLTLTDVRSTEQVALAQGHAKKTDLGWGAGGARFGGGGTEIRSTAAGVSSDVAAG